MLQSESSGFAFVAKSIEIGNGQGKKNRKKRILFLLKAILFVCSLLLWE